MTNVFLNLKYNFNYLKYFFRLFCLPFFFFIYLFNLFFNNFNNFNLINSKYFFQKKRWNFLFFNKFYFFLDFYYIYFLSFIYKNIEFNNINFRIKFRLNQVNWAFYNDLKLSNSLNFNIIHYLSGLRFIWNGLKYWLVGLILGLSSFYYLTYIRLLPFNKVIFEWILIIMFLYWLMSGFVFFIKKYQYSKFTSVIQRFWKRSYILFWCIESATFLVFFYLTLNSPEEPVYMYDQIKLFKTHLFSWRLFLPKLIPVISLIVLSYFLILNIKWTNFSKQSLILVIITLILIYVFWLEFYQFFHIISYYENLVWSFDNEEFLWNLDSEFKRTRIVNNAVTICLLAKFWHLVFIFVFWIFFILRINEVGRVRYPLLAANTQNFIILYIMSWLYMYPWLKFAFRRHLENTYYWYFYNARRLGLRIFFNDLIIFYKNFFSFEFINLYYFNSGLFYYWMESSTETNLLQYKKHLIRDLIISNLNY